MECHVCRYDLEGRVPGDLCPECGVAFDGRSGHPASGFDARVVFWCGVMAVVTVPLVPVSFLIACFTMSSANMSACDPKQYRMAESILRRRKAGVILAWTAIGLQALAIGTAIVLSDPFGF